MPVVDAVAADFGDRIDFVAPAWHSDFQSAESRALGTFVSGNVMWGLDDEEDIVQLYNITYQPMTVLITADRTIFTSWSGVKPEHEIRAILDRLLAATG